MINKIAKIDQVQQLINNGNVLVVAGPKETLKKLPAGNWIGATMNYFMTENFAKEIDNNSVFVTDFTEFVSDFNIKIYSKDSLKDIPANYADQNGLNYILIPGNSDISQDYAIFSEQHPDLFLSPLVGWVSGVKLEDVAFEKANIINGQDKSFYDERIIVLHLKIKDNFKVKIDVVNTFVPGEGDKIMFTKDTFKIDEAIINGVPTNFADYIKQHNIDTRYPLVSEYNNSYLNVSIKEVFDYFVETYAPVRKGTWYKFAKPFESSYQEMFTEKIKKINTTQNSTSWNCILNYLYADLENKKLNFVGPFTFGEIVYIMLNQTFVNINFIEC